MCKERRKAKDEISCLSDIKHPFIIKYNNVLKKYIYKYRVI